MTLLLTLSFTATARAFVEIHLHHQKRFLQERSTLEQELTAWKRSEAGQFALENGFYSEPTEIALNAPGEAHV